MALELARHSMDEALALRIERSLLQMEALIAQYLDFSGNSVKEGTSPLSVATLLKEVAQTFRNANIEFNVSENIVYLPSRAFIRCAQNLLDNAVKHGEGKLIDVHFHKSGANWILEIADHGQGIPAHQLDLVFQPFRRLDNARTQTGSGLGLSIVHEICRVQGWFVSLLPRPGGGLIARLSIPIAAQD
jgi:two-component system osmolarity sensor histidine kinase EnvZ